MDAKPGRMQALIVGRMVGWQPLSHCSRSLRSDRENCMKHPSSSNPYLSIPMTGRTLPIPKMQRVKRRAQTGSPDLCSSAAPTASAAKQKTAASRTAGKGWAH